MRDVVENSWNGSRGVESGVGVRGDPLKAIFEHRREAAASLYLSTTDIFGGTIKPFFWGLSCTLKDS